MNPLSDDETYLRARTELNTLIATEAYKTSEKLFEPYFPESWYVSNPTHKKVLWCGSATRGWNSTVSEFYKRLKNNPKDRHWISQSIFWRTMRSVGRHLEKHRYEYDTSLRYSTTDQPKTVVWSNVFRVGGCGGEPSRALAEKQAEASKECLKREIELAKPDAVIFHTGHLSTSFTSCYFGDDEDKAIDIPGREGRIGRYMNESLSVPHFWMTRRQGMTDKTRIKDALAAFKTLGWAHEG